MRTTGKRNPAAGMSLNVRKINGLPKYRCKNCGCVEEVSFVKGYMRGLEHGKY